MIKPNWPETRQHFIDWWERRGIVLGQWGYGVVDPAKDAVLPRPTAATLEEKHSSPEYLAAFAEWELGRRIFPADSLPLACPGLQTVELASYLGAGLAFDEETIWYTPSLPRPEELEVSLDVSNKWFQRMTRTLSLQSSAGLGKYLPSLPAISPNLDVLAELRGAEGLMMDLIERPEWVKWSLDQIDELFFAVHDRYYNTIRQPDGGSAFYYFMIWAPGKVTQLQCDVAAMISPAMFEEFALPGFATVSNAIDYTLFHVDGPPMLQHLDLLLSIASLDAIEFTPGPGVPEGADEHWHGLYRRILDAGKSVQVVVSDIGNIEPLLSALGANGIYLLCFFDKKAQFDEAEEIVSRFRR